MTNEEKAMWKVDVVSKHPLYSIWRGMKSRCYDKSSKSYKNYGARGITVCARWLNSFQDFVTDMGQRPKGASIDRINNDLGYSPENCRWATKKEQARNTRLTRFVSWRGKRIAVADLANEAGIPHRILRERIVKGMDAESAISCQPSKNANRKYGPRPRHYLKAAIEWLVANQ